LSFSFFHSLLVLGGGGRHLFSFECNDPICSARLIHNSPRVGTGTCGGSSHNAGADGASAWNRKRTPRQEGKKRRNLLEIEPHVIRYSQNGVIYPRNSLRQSARFQIFPPFPLIQFENHRKNRLSNINN
jgi:hypothetical protein